jgi:hypothetical protein
MKKTQSKLLFNGLRFNKKKLNKLFLNLLLPKIKNLL